MPTRLGPRPSLTIIAAFFRRVADLLRFAHGATAGTGHFGLIPPKRDQCGHDCRAEKQPDNAKRLQPAENPQQHP